MRKLIIILLLSSTCLAQAILGTRHRQVAAPSGCTDSDNFRGTSLDTTTDWTVNSGTFAVSSGLFQGSSATTDELAFWKACATSWANNQFAQVTIGTRLSQGAGPAVRVQNSGTNGYIVHCDSGAMKLFKEVAGTATQLGSSSTCANGDVVKVTAVGTTIEVYKNGSGTPSITSTDSAFSSGNPGITAYGSGANTTAGTFVAGEI